MEVYFPGIAKHDKINKQGLYYYLESMTRMDKAISAHVTSR